MQPPNTIAGQADPLSQFLDSLKSIALTLRDAGDLHEGWDAERDRLRKDAIFLVGRGQTPKVVSDATGIPVEALRPYYVPKHIAEAMYGTSRDDD